MNFSPERTFLKLTDAAEVTGLSTYYLRRGCRDGSVPHIRSGNKYLVNVKALLEIEDAKSRRQVNAS